MDVPMIVTRSRTRTPLAALGKLTVVGVSGIGLALIYLQAAMIGMLIPPLAVFAVISFVVAGVVLGGWRWVPLLGALWSVFIIAGNSTEIAYNLSHPTEVRGFAFTLFILAMALIGLAAGIAATVQNYRSSERRTPRTLAVGLALMLGLCAGAVLTAASAAGGVNAGVSPETLMSLPALKTANFAFDQQEIRVKVGETVALRLENSDSEGHSFDIDAFGVHAALPPGKTSLALFKPTQPGTYTFYCAPHYNKATSQGMQGTLIVE
jgi:plastocyanin